MQLSIVVTTRNRKQKLLECLESIKKSDLAGIVFEVIVIDDFSIDGTEKLKEKDFNIENLRIIHNKKNLTMAASRNIGAKASSGEHILFVDDDNVIGRDMIKKLLEYAIKNEKTGIIGPQMHCLDNSQKYFSCQKFSFWTGKTNCYNSNDRKSYPSDGIPNVFLVAREVFGKCGYFDEKLMQTFTEPDLFFRAKKDGQECLTIEGAKTYHDIGLQNRFHPDELGGDFPAKAYCVMRNRSVMVGRYGKLIHKLIYGIFFSWLWPLAYSAMVLLYGRFDLIKLYWRGWWDGMIFLMSDRLRDFKISY